MIPIVWIAALGFMMLFVLLSNLASAQAPTYVRVNALGANPYGSNLLVMNFDSTNFPLPQPGTIFHLINQGTANGRMTFDNYYNGGVQGTQIIGRRARGYLSAPTAPQLNDVLIAITGDGYGVDSFSNKATISMVFRRDSGAYNNTSKPSKMVFATTPEGSTTQVDRAIIDAKGRMWLLGLPDGFTRSISGGMITSAPLSNSEVTTALGFTPANAATTPTAASIAAKADTATTYTRLASDARYLNKSDTAAMLIPYIKGNIAAANYATIASLASTNSNVNQKVNISDTANMLLSYKNAINTNATNIATKQNQITLTTTGSGASTLIGNTLNIPQSTSYAAGTGISIALGSIINTAPDQNVSISAGNAMAVTGTYPSFTVAQVQPTINLSPGRTANSNYIISATKAETVFYTVTTQVTNPLLAGTSTANAYFEYSTNTGSTWNTVSQTGNSSNVGITVTLQLTTSNVGIISGVVPANALCRIRTATSGSASISLNSQQEITY